MNTALQALGLTPAQIEAYLFLLEHGQTTPPQLANQLQITRTNAYKLFDRLVELGLATRQDVAKKLAYAAEDPIVLTDLLAAERNRMLALEHGLKETMHQLRSKYRVQTGKTEIKTFTGKAKLKQLYEQQATTGQPIHFIATRADIPLMGYETMDHVRRLSKRHEQPRFGIVTDNVGGPVDPSLDERSNLTRTWLPAEEYDAPVEWSVSGNEVTLFIFEKQGSAIRINHPAVAQSFRQLWHIMDHHLRADPVYCELPRKASRSV